MLLLFAGDGSWFNYPGLEVWKFVNLAIFVVLGIYFLRSKINQGLLARRGAIQQELIAAKAERDQALARVAEADNLLSRLHDDVRIVHEQARQEAEQERQRIAAGTEREIEKLKQQGQREAERADKLARKELREYLAKRSIELARESLRNQIRPEDDTLLIKESIGELRRTTV
jgi:F0F1-type ATP synthase membrane subunit b/b'